MQITNNTTPFPAELIVFTDKHAVKHCIVVVKATFDVEEEDRCEPAAKQEPFVYADQHYGDPGTTSIEYEMDFAPVKRLADVLVKGSACAPPGRMVRKLDVALAGPGFEKRAVVFGDRQWERRLLGIEASDPAPFDVMPLVWDRSFGGSDTSSGDGWKNGTELRNLVGVGFHLNGAGGTIVGKALPNVERPDALMRVWSDKPAPLGFAPVGRGWQPRIGFAGTYDQKWMDERLPFLPDDFDDRYFQAAPIDQQVTGLKAGATFRCINMTPDGRPFVVRLPVFEIPVRFHFTDRIHSCTIGADTVVLQPAERRVVLLARTSVTLPRKVQMLQEIQVGEAKRRPSSKPHYARLGDAVEALRRRR